MDTTSEELKLQADVKAVNKITIVPSILDVICRTTGMGFAAIARVTESRWITCSCKDDISFGIKPGDELKVETTICHEVRQSETSVVIDHVEKDKIYCNHPTPALYGFQSYISFPIFKRDGSFFGTLCAIDPRPLKVNKPEVVEMFRLFADLLSFHLEAVEELNKANADLVEEREIAEVREKFIAILGHDLKNPLGTTRMCADMLLHMALDEKAQRHARMIKSTTYRMESLIENILDFARGHLGEGIQLYPTSDKESLKKTLHQVINEVEAMAPGREINATIKLNKSFPCDEERVAQLFSNLLGNAVTHGAVDAPINVKAICENGHFELSVKNAGEKISTEAMKHLFRPFYRDDIKPGKQGLGLGLYISSEIAKAHKGHIEVNSTEQETSFTFKMPCN